MTVEQLALDDCEPDWDDDALDHRPSDRTPTPTDLRLHEMRDLREQGPDPTALWTAHNVPTGSYL